MVQFTERSKDHCTFTCSKGGKANYYNENGRCVGKGNGDLNH